MLNFSRRKIKIEKLDSGSFIQESILHIIYTWIYIKITLVGISFSTINQIKFLLKHFQFSSPSIFLGIIDLMMKKLAIPLVCEIIDIKMVLLPFVDVFSLESNFSLVLVQMANGLSLSLG